VTLTAQTLGTWKLGVKAKSGASSYTLDVSYPDPPTAGLRAVDRASDAGIAQITRSYGTFVHDVGVDGDQDFLYNRHSGSRMLLSLNDGDGNFVVSPDVVFPVHDRHDCVWADLNDDHRPDTYCAVGASKGRNIKKNELWLQNENGVLSAVAGAWEADDPTGRGRDPALFDANRDGLLDLFVGNFFPRVDGLQTPNRFYIQDPAGTFDPAPEYGVDRQIGGQRAEPADFDETGGRT
jgi:FG-GAP-like repeat